MNRVSTQDLIVLLAKRKEKISTNVSTVYFDGSCPLCTLEMTAYKSQAGAEDIKFVDVSLDDAPLVDGLSREDAMRRFHVSTHNGKLLSGASAFVAVWESLSNFRWAARIGRIPGCLTLLEAFYRLFLPIRPILSRIAWLLGAKAENPRSN